MAPIMDMVHMVKTPVAKILSSFRIKPIIRLCSAVLILTPFSISSAVELEINPKLAISEAVTTNQSANDPIEEANVTEIKPGVEIDAKGNRLKLGGNYNYEKIIDHSSPEERPDNYRYNSTAAVELIKKRLTLSGAATRFQRVSDPLGKLSLDNSGPVTENRTNQEALSGKLDWDQPVGRFVTSKVSGRRSVISSSTDARPDSTIDSFSANMENGKWFKRSYWKLNGKRSAIYYSNDDSIVRESADAELGVLATRRLKLGYKYGYETNPLLQANKEEKGDVSIAVAEWTASRKLKISVLSGQRSYGYTWGTLVEWAPTARTDISLGRSREKYGAASKAEIKHRYRRGKLELSYVEVPDNEAINFEKNITVRIVDKDGNPILDEDTGEEKTLDGILRIQGILTYIKKQAMGSFSYEGRRTTLVFKGVRQKNEPLNSRLGELVHQANGAWSYRPNKKGLLKGVGIYQENELEALNIKERRYAAKMIYQHKLGKNMNTSIEYQHMLRTTRVASERQEIKQGRLQFSYIW